MVSGTETTDFLTWSQFANYQWGRSNVSIKGGYSGLFFSGLFFVPIKERACLCRLLDELNFVFPYVLDKRVIVFLESIPLSLVGSNLKFWDRESGGGGYLHRDYGVEQNACGVMTFLASFTIV